MPVPMMSPRFGRIVCDDEIEDAIIETITSWSTAYLAEIERQRGWEPQSLEPLKGVVPVAFLGSQPEDAPPFVAVRVERIAGVMVPASREASMDWRVVLEVYADGAEEDDTRKRVRAYVAAVRALLIRHGATTTGVVSNMRLVGTDYTPTLQEKGRTVGAGVVEFVAGVQDAVTRFAGPMQTPPVDPYAVPAGLVEVEATESTVGVM